MSLSRSSSEGRGERVPDSFRLEYKIAASSAVDAGRLQRSTPFNRYRLVDTLIAATGVAVAAFVDPSTGLAIAAFGLVLLGLTRWQYPDRWLYARRARSLIGGTIVYVVDDAGIHYETPLGSGLVQWSALTAVRANDKTIVFSRDRVIAAYVPASAFLSRAERDGFLAYAGEHIPSAPVATTP